MRDFIPPPAPTFEHYPDLADSRCAVTELLGRHPPPLFVGERRILEDRYRRLDRVMASTWPSHVIGFSFKTSYPVARSGFLRDLGCWAEVVSGREYEMARELGYPGERIIFNGPYKTDGELERALGEGALVNLNDLEELRRVRTLAASADRPWSIGLRVASNRLGLRRPTRFGLSLDDGEAERAMDELAGDDRVELAGLHMHLLGDTDDVEIYRRACRTLGAFCRDQGLDALRYVDLGGGFPAHGPQPRSRTTWDPRPIEEYVRGITAELAPVFAGERRPTLVLEPGRYLACDAVVLVTQVIRAVRKGDRQELVANGAITMLPLIHYCPQLVRAFSPDFEGPHTGEEIPTMVYGSSCREDDVLFEGVLPAVSVGDHLVHYAAGAYNQNLSPGFIFATPPVLFY